MTRMLLPVVLVSGFGLALPPKAYASKTIVGRTTDYSATDMTSVAPAATPRLSLSARQPAPAPSTTSEAKSSDLLSSMQVKALIATANTPADHMKLQKHYLAVAAKYEADATEHAAEAQAYRKNPSFMESKHPAGPRTAAHCDRFAQLHREAAKEARDLASAHEHMAAAK